MRERARAGLLEPDSLRIEGGHPLAGAVRVGGFKHALVPMLAATVLSEGRTTLCNVPDIEDTRVALRILRSLGVTASFTDGAHGDGRTLTIDATTVRRARIPDDLASRVHGSLYLVPSLLGRMGEVDIALPGGCRIGDAAGGARPTAHVIDVLRRFGAVVTHEGGRLRGSSHGLHGAHVDILEFSTHPTELRGAPISGATKTALIAASCARGVSRIDHPYRRIEVEELIAFLRTCGVAIEDQGRTLTVEGRPRLAPGRHRVAPDLIEIVTFAACAIHAQASLTLTGLRRGVVERGLCAELAIWAQMGVGLRWNDDESLRIEPPPRLKSVDIETLNDSIYSDSQPFFSLMLLSGDRPARVREAVWHNRFGFAHELVRLGAEIVIGEGEILVVPSRPGATGLHLSARDLRAASVLTLAALGAPGPNTVAGASHLVRGYEDFVGKLRGIGARVEQEASPLESVEAI